MGDGWRLLEWKLDVDDGGDALHGLIVLGVVEEEFQARLRAGVPLEDVELALLKGLRQWAAKLRQQAQFEQ